MPARLCNRCSQTVPLPANLCSCGGEAVDYFSTAESPPSSSEGPNGIPDTMAVLGSMLTKGSNLGAAVGYAVGKKIEKSLGSRTLVTFKKEEVDPPPRDIAKEAAATVREKGGKLRAKMKTVLAKLKKKKTKP